MDTNENNQVSQVMVTCDTSFQDFDDEKKHSDAADDTLYKSSCEECHLRKKHFLHGHMSWAIVQH